MAVLSIPASGDFASNTQPAKRVGSQEFPQTTMRVTKRNGSAEPVDLNKIVRAVSRSCAGLPEVDALRVATKTISGLYDGATTTELDRLSIQTAASLITEEPQYGKLAARLLATFIDKEVRNQEIHSFSQAISNGQKLGLVNARLADVVSRNARKLNDTIAQERDNEFDYFGLRTVYDRYLLRNPKTRLVIETPQQFFLRIATALTETMADTRELYHLLSNLEYLPSSPTLFNSGTAHEQLSSCFLLDSPADSLEAIYKRYTDVALLSKFSGGIGLAYHRVRSRGSLIESTNGHSNGIVPWLKTLDASVSAVNQGGKRKGAACVYLESWHADIEEFLELRDNTGDVASRAHNLNIANWIPDLFMKRVEANADWSLFDPKVVPALPDLWGWDFEQAYEAAERAGLAAKTIKARDLYARMMRTLAQTGNGWITFKDASNRACNQTAAAGRVVHLSNLCVAPETKILTQEGYREIADLRDQDVEIWNGSRWSKVTVKQTGHAVQLVRVVLSNGASIDCTPQHKFAVAEGYTGRWDFVDAVRLLPGTRLAKFDMPVIAGGVEGDLAVAYAHGFFCGDGTYEGSRRDIPKIVLYGEKKKLVDYLDIDNHRREGSANGTIHVVYKPGRIPPKFQVPDGMSQSYRLAWLAGLIDSDGTVARNGINESIQIGSILPEFLGDVRLLLTTLGVSAKVTLEREAGETWLPDGKGGHAWYPTQDMYRVLISSGDAKRLFDLGLPIKRCKLEGRKPQRDAHHFVKVVEVIDTGRISDTFCFTEPFAHLGVFNGIVTGQCTEILEITTENETAVCNLGSINLGRHLPNRTFDFAKLARTVRTAIRQLDRVIDLGFYPIPEAKYSNLRWRPVGLGVMGLQDVFFQLGLAFDSTEARALSRQIAEEIYFQALTASSELAAERGKHPLFDETRAAQGEFQFQAWGAEPADSARWEALRARIRETGLRNSLMIAIAPTATIASIAGCYECIEPQVSNLFKRETMSGDFIQINRYLVDRLKTLGLWTEHTRSRLILAEGSVQSLIELPEDVRKMFRTVWEVPMRSLIDMAADRGAFIDQSQSLNLFVESPNIGALSAMYFHAWKRGLKTTYYLRSRSATKVAKSTAIAPIAAVRDEAAVSCSLENPGSCEACQ
jgi:ribonucleoside-diphosphate reductase alpha chain